jgi:GLPGLI family protein
MKTYLFLLFFTFSIAFSQSQNGEVIYSYFAYGAKKEAKLRFNNNESIFTIKNDQLNKKKVDVIGKDEGKSNMNIDLYFNFDVNIPINFGMITDIKSNFIIDHKFLPIDFTAVKFDTLFVKHTARTISWELLKETKNINSFNCQKARGNFRGRTYTVWFTNDIPVSLGPWKLNGLPGLILEASDSLNQFQFFAEKIELQMEVNTIDTERFFNQNYITPIEERKKYISFVKLMFNEISTKIDASLPRGVVSTTNNAKAKMVDENNFMEINFDDIKLK